MRLVVVRHYSLRKLVVDMAEVLDTSCCMLVVVVLPIEERSHRILRKTQVGMRRRLAEKLRHCSLVEEEDSWEEDVREEMGGRRWS
jgi:hypothetical protein